MPFTSADRTAIETRSLLAQHRDKKIVARILQSRGIDEEEAHDLVRTIHKQNLWENRKLGIGICIVGGLGVLVFGGILLFAHRFFVFWLPASVITLLWGFIKFVTASGYEMES
jgi:hypothetical protein